VAPTIDRSTNARSIEDPGHRFFRLSRERCVGLVAALAGPDGLVPAPAERSVDAEAVLAFCARCRDAPTRMSTAASTAARPPARVLLSLAQPGAPPLRLVVSELPFADGGLGFRLFPAAVWLAALLVANWPALRSDSVLELGAGLGAPGLACALLGARCVLTDFNTGLLRALAAAAAENGVAQRVRVAHCDWAAEAALSASDPALRELANPEYWRVRRQEAAAGDPAFPPLPPAQRFDLVLATEVLYEAHAARVLPPLVAARLRPRGRFFTLMAVRDASILRAFLAGLGAAAPRLLVAVCAAKLLPLPTPQAGGEAAAGGGDEPPPPFCPGLRWMDAAACEAAVMTGGPGGGPLAAAWVEALSWPDERAGAPAASAAPCCSRAARGLACPCARARASSLDRALVELSIDHMRCTQRAT